MRTTLEGSFIFFDGGIERGGERGRGVGAAEAEAGALERQRHGAAAAQQVVGEVAEVDAQPARADLLPQLAAQDGDYVEGINALRALREKLIDDQTYVRLMQGIHEKLTDLGVADLNLRGTHILLSRRVTTGELVRGADGVPETRICNFELLRMTRGWGE